MYAQHILSIQDIVREAAVALGRKFVIEEDCWIGSNIIIPADVRVGKGSTVGAGSLLQQVVNNRFFFCDPVADSTIQDVPRFTVVAGNPAKASQGIYNGSGDNSKSKSILISSTSSLFSRPLWTYANNNIEK